MLKLTHNHGTELQKPMPISLPPVTRNLLIANVAVFLLQQVMPGLLGWLALWPLGSGLFEPWQIVTNGFMHGGIAHLLGNMWFLWIFGNNIEDDLGHLRYLLFYLLTGIVASLCHVVLNLAGDNALVPSLGASGAISGVMGAYLILHSQRPVRVILLRMMTIVPGWVAVGMWFLFQLVSVMGLLGGSSEGGGVAYAAHIGGFIAGALLAKPFTIGRPAKGVQSLGYSDSRRQWPRE